MNARRRTWADRKDVALGRIVREVLRRHNGIRAHAARELGIERTHLQKLMKRYGLTGES